jgi:hypothetical protein
MNQEEAENLFLDSSSPKIKQKIELLRLNKTFLTKADLLREKWKFLIKEFFSSYMKFENILDTEVIDNKYKISPPSKKGANIIKKSLEKAQEKFTNKDFEKDIIKLTSETKLYPVEYWKNVVSGYVLTEIFVPLNIFLKSGLEDYIPKKEVLRVPPRLNFAPKIIKNKKTKELELFIQIFDDTSLQDIKDNWNLVGELQKKIRKDKGMEKRFYPQKNINIFKKIINLMKNGLSNWEIQEKIYGEKTGLDFGKKEKKAIDNIRQIKHRGKKHIK